MSLPKYDWDTHISEMISSMDEKGKSFSIMQYAKDNKLPYFELCRQWANSPKYRPIIGRGRSQDRLVREGNNSFDNIILPEADIKFIQVAKAVTSPIRFYILRYLLQGPKTIAEFITEHQFAYYTCAGAFKFLERMHLVEVCGKQSGYNLYQLSKKETIAELFAIIEAL